MTAPRQCALPGCDIEFAPQGPRAYCSPQHRRLAQYRREHGLPADGVPTQTCARPDCGVVFAGRRNKRYCSNECMSATAYRRASGLPLDGHLPPRVCALPTCGKSFTPSLKEVKKKWCSRVCRNAAHGKERLGLPIDGTYPTATCERCGVEFPRRRSDARFCSKRCKHATLTSRLYHAKTPGERRLVNEGATAHQARRRMKAAGFAGATFDRSVTLGALIERDANTCWLCGLPCAARDWERHNATDYPTIDHLLPIIKGGSHTWTNVRLAHRACNSEKHDDVCQSCGGPITDISEPVCAKCAARGRKAKVRYGVCAHCGYVELPGGFCSMCKAKGPGLWLATDLTRADANALSRSRTTRWITWLDEVA